MSSNTTGNDSIKILTKIYQWRKPLIIVTLVAAILSSIVSFLISPQYLATAIIFPARTFSVSKLLVELNTGNQEDYMEYGDEDDCEKLLQILNSADIRNSIADEYNLWQHWKINKDNALGNYYMKLKWTEMVSFKRTDYLSIKINVYDYQSDRAAKIANSIVSYADSVKNRMTKVVAKEALMIIKEEYEVTLENIKTLEDSLQSIREVGVIDYKSETEAYAKAMAKAVSKGDDAAVKRLEKKMDLIQTYGMAYQDLFEKLKKYRFKYLVIVSKYDDARVNYERNLPSNFLIEKAVRIDKPARPFKTLIVAISTVSAFILSLIYLLFSDKLLDIRKTIIQQSKKD
ncbi:MAG: Wzz/FepE/Etk N-terminal domain-containing protein [Bacteroidota bacterium]